MWRSIYFCVGFGNFLDCCVVEVVLVGDLDFIFEGWMYRFDCDFGEGSVDV